MATQSSFITKVITTGSFVLAAALIAPASLHFHGLASNAFAEEEGSHEGGKGGKSGQEGSKGHKGTEGKGSKGDIFHGDENMDPESDGKGPRMGKPGTNGQKTKPVWSSEGIPEGDYGRLNVARAPQHTRDQALAEAVATVTDWSLYNMTLEQAIAAIKTYRIVPIVRVDSPTEALALYQALLRDGKITDPDATVQISSSNALVQAAIFLASASDKTKPITVDTVVAMNTILGVNNPAGVSNEQLASAAEEVRAMILLAHDSVEPVVLP